MDIKKRELIVCGKYRYYAINEVAKDMLRLIRYHSFSKKTLDMLSKYFSISIIDKGDVKAFDDR